MKQSIVCQSCSMPMDNPELWGSEKDGSRSTEFCKFCYQDGAFTHPGFTLDDMKSHMMAKMDQAQLPPDILEAAVARLPQLKRWKRPVPGGTISKKLST